MQCYSKCKVYCKGNMDRKLFKTGNGWGLFIPQTILKLLEINPEADMVKYKIENDVLKITKGKKLE